MASQSWSRNYIFGCAILRITGVRSKKNWWNKYKNHFERGCRDGKLVKVIGIVSCAVVVNDHIM